EFIIVDDGSTDATVDILKIYAHKDARIRILSQANRGLTMALNFAVEHARGTYIARQDADDISSPERVSKQLARIGNASLITSSWLSFNPENKFKKTRLYSLFSALPQFLQKRVIRYVNPCAHGTYLFLK